MFCYFLITLCIVWYLVRRRVTRRLTRLQTMYNVLKYMYSKPWWENDDISIYQYRTGTGNKFNLIMRMIVLGGKWMSWQMIRRIHMKCAQFKTSSGVDLFNVFPGVLFFKLYTPFGSICVRVFRSKTLFAHICMYLASFHGGLLMHTASPLVGCQTNSFDWLKLGGIMAHNGIGTSSARISGCLGTGSLTNRALSPGEANKVKQLKIA